MSDYHIRDACRLCSAPLPNERVLDLGETPLANEYPTAEFVASGKKQDAFPLYLVQCAACGHVQLPVVVDPKRLFPATYPYQSGTSPVFLSHLHDLANAIDDLKPNTGWLLDIGSNDGTFLRCFSGSGWAVVGVDPAAPDRCGYRAFFTRGWAEAHRRETGRQYDVITALNVFAHVDDLNDFTAGVAELLAPDGVFVFEVGYVKDVCERGLVGTLYHEHLSYHTLRPLQTFFHRHGLTMYDAELVDSQGGSIRCYVRRGIPDYENRTARLMALLEAESAPDVSRLRATIDDTRRRVYGLHTTFTAGGGKVAAFGAPAKLTTWAYALGMGPGAISCVYDDNERKVGRFTPGNFWPIVPSSRLLEDNPDAVVLFSSNFEAEIRERFAAYRGEWIVV